MLDYSQISNEPDIAFARKLIIEHGVAAIPPSALYHKNDDHNVLRFCFAKKVRPLKRPPKNYAASEGNNNLHIIENYSAAGTGASHFAWDVL
jgi:hypothetical protein